MTGASVNGQCHRALRESLGAYLLDQLDPREAGRVSAHAETCALCRAELAELRPVAEALRDADPGRIGTRPEPSPELGDRIVAGLPSRSRSPERRAISRTALAAVAAGVVGLAVGTASTLLPAPAEGPQVEPVALTQVQGGVEAEGSLVAHSWGTELKLVVEGLQDDQVYAVEFSDADGRTVDAGTFLGTEDGPVRCNLNVAIPRSEATSFVVATSDGDPVLRADLA